MKHVILHVPTNQLIGPFDTNAEANDWAEKMMPMETVDFEDVMAPSEFFPYKTP